jgi:hypothetical protein
MKIYVWFKETSLILKLELPIEVGNINIGSYPYLGLTSASQYGSANGLAFTQMMHYNGKPVRKLILELILHY